MVMAAGASSLVQILGRSRADHRGGLPLALNNQVCPLGVNLLGVNIYPVFPKPWRGV